MTGAATVSPEAPLKVPGQKLVVDDRGEGDDNENDLDYSLTTDEGSLRGSNIPDEKITKDSSNNKNLNSNNDVENDKDKNNNDNGDATNENNERRRFIPIRSKKLLKKGSSKNKEKVMCEYFNEEDNLDEGDLPSLHIPGTSPVSSSSQRRVVSPSPSHASMRDRDGGAATPVLDNTVVKKNKKGKDKEKDDLMMKKKKWNAMKKTANANNKDVNLNGSGNNPNNVVDGEKDVVTIAAPKLNSDDKRKHRVFWDQFDLKHSDESENGSQTDGSDLAPRDERGSSKFVPRKKEVLQNEDEDDDDKGIISMVVDMCSDCGGWMAGDSDNNDNQKAKRRRSSSRLEKERDLDRELNNIISDDEDRPSSRLRARKDDDSIMTRELSVVSRGDTSHRTETDDESRSSSVRRKRRHLPRENSARSSTSHLSTIQFETREVEEPQNYENTKIEVEYEEEDPQFLQLNQNGDVSLYARPGDSKQVNSNNAQDVPSINREPMPSDEQRYQTKENLDRSISTERGGYLLTKSTSWSEPQKSAYLQAMAQKAKQDFNKRKGVLAEQTELRNVPRTPERGKMRVQDDEDSLSGILGKNEGKEQAPKSPKAIDWARHNWTPSEKRRLFHLVKSEGMSPEEATEVVIASRSKRRIGYAEHSSDDVPQKSEEVVKPRSKTPNTRRASAFQPTSPRKSSSLSPQNKNSQFPMDEEPSSPPTSKVELSHDSVVSPLKSVGSPGSITSRSKKAGSKILSNLRKRPGFSRVVEANIQEQSVDGSCEESVEISLEQSGDRSIPVDDGDVQSPGSKSVKSLKKKKALKSGRVWHQINDNDDEYVGGENVVDTAQNNRSSKDTARNDDIFDFESVEGAEEKKGPLDTVKLDPYYDSCDVSHLGSMMTGDHTVMSSNRSVYTTATNSSSWSTSTRRRHRGAAKNRHPDEKNDQKPNGWLDSIRAAAQSNNREWDPQVGWVGYVDPGENNKDLDEKQEVVRIGKLKAPKVAKSIRDLRHQAALSAKMNESTEEDVVSVPFPSQWEKERDDMVSVYRDDDGTSSAVTEIIKNSMGDNDEIDVVSHAETEIVSNQIKGTSRIVYNKIPERIVEDSYYSDDDDDGPSSAQNGNGIGQERLGEIEEEEEENYETEEKDGSVDEGNEKNSDHIISLQTEARGSLKEMVFSSDVKEVSNPRKTFSPVIKEDEHKIEEESFSFSPQSNRSASYKSIGPHSPGSVSRKSDSNDLVNKKKSVFGNGASSDTAASSSGDEYGEEFDNGMSSFDFSEVGKVEATEDSGFKVIKNAPSSPVFKLSDMVFVDVDGEEPNNDDKSVTSTSSMMSQRAKQWREKVEAKKRTMPSQREEVLVEEQIHDHGNIFVSAADDNSTIEYRERPKILNADEEDTLFDFGGAIEETTAKSVKKKVEGPNDVERNHSSKLSNLERNHSLNRRKSKIEDDQSIDDMSEITTPTVDMTKPDGTFLDRLHSCTVDTVGNCDQKRSGSGSGLPRAHLQFLRNNSTADVGGASNSKDNRAGGLINMLTSPGLCGRAESVEDFDDEKPRRKSKSSNLASSYLEAINANTGKGGSEVRKTPSVLSSSSGQSETWQRFLDKRAVALSSRRSNTDVSKAAQEYASKKVDEIVKRVNNEDSSKRKSAVFPLTRPPSSSRANLRTTSTSRRQARQASDEMMSKSDAAKAAEDLAAARVEAMMAMAPRALSQDESEI